ncbi:hypothetical protein BAUCODRAFT_73419 [Baudoinia panamericana UAMH 10762]|uniref:Cytochrome b5 heme-binding domain-containing protein n=1 Tax=Baudoinia panamericana (strain UAMH 10762) TaxID=717646 RepID=M2N7E5_BAUPA|nr:uncharacterized protein BAUCODRAFT_73419 [Baudoinia panamericana UAMH 10762]EMC94725.1 hypothetical protein BAUCODRAFT_73419 [Baudoinia panamericana UAMH 10762]
MTSRAATSKLPEIPAPTIALDEAPLEGETTPKAVATQTSDEVPTFSLSAPDEHLNSSHLEPVAKSSSPGGLSARDSMAPRPKISMSTPSANSRGPMPPPARPAVPRMGAPSVASSLRIPSTGPLPNRGPPASSQQRVSSGLAPSGNLLTPNPRSRIVLTPGHSPMDWAAKSRSADLAGVGTFLRVKPSQLKQMTGRKGKPAWSSWQGKVYNITPYLPYHPGGEGQLMRAAGKDGEQLFMETHPWVNWENMLGSCLVGVLVPEGHGMEGAQPSLEDMD